ncbi:MAG: hypothetical protein KU29_10130, partial [Sulfurovum sp. FS06-10]
IAHSSTLNISNAITISTWVNFNNINIIEYGKDWVSILTKNNFAKSYGLMFSLGDNKLWRFYHNGASSDNTDYQSKNITTINNWFFVTATYNNSVSKIYINDMLVSSNNTNGAIESNSDDIFLAKSGGNWFPYFFNGEVDDLRIYNRALDESEIKELYNRGK